jgi:hypothetical protein
MSPGASAATGTTETESAPTNFVAVSAFSAERLAATARVRRRMFWSR